MKILAAVPIEYVQLNPAMSTYRSEVKEVEVTTILRIPADRRRRGYYYRALLKDPRSVIPFDNLAYTMGLVCVNRKLNPRWKPPVFPEGKDRVEVSA